MADPIFTRQFLRELAEWEGASSPADRDRLDEALALIANNPEVAGRVPTYYDPANPSFLYRAGPVLLHYRVGSGTVTFLNMFYERVR